MPILGFSHLPSLITFYIMFHPVVSQLIQAQTEFSHYFITLMSHFWGSHEHSTKTDTMRGLGLHEATVVVTQIQTRDQICPCPCPGAEHILIPKSTLAIVWCVEINKDPANEQAEAIYSEFAVYSKGVYHHDITRSDDSKAGRREPRLCGGESEASGCSHWGLLDWGSHRQAS